MKKIMLMIIKLFLHLNVEKLRQDLTDTNQKEAHNDIEKDIDKDSISDSEDSSISESY